MRISDWSSDVCSSDLAQRLEPRGDIAGGDVIAPCARVAPLQPVAGQEADVCADRFPGDGRRGFGQGEAGGGEDKGEGGREGAGTKAHRVRNLLDRKRTRLNSSH